MQVLLARDAPKLGFRSGMAAKVKGQADAAERGDFAGANQVGRLAAAPAVNEQHPGERTCRGEQCACEMLIFDRDFNRCLFRFVICGGVRIW